MVQPAVTSGFEPEDEGSTPSPAANLSVNPQCSFVSSVVEFIWRAFTTEVTEEHRATSNSQKVFRLSFDEKRVVHGEFMSFGLSAE